MLSGVVVDRTGSLLVGAEVALLTQADTEVARTATDPAGRFRFEGLADASYVLDVRMSGFAPARRIVHVAPGEPQTLRIALELAPQTDAVTVTPVRGDIRRLQDVPEATTVTGADVLSHRSYTTFPQALREEPGVSVQQTSTSQGSPFVRGFTGQHVVSYVDGVRFNNSTFRPGANQYTALIEPQFVDRVEIVRGPTSTQYGSDALGGAINVDHRARAPLDLGQRVGRDGERLLRIGRRRSGGGGAEAALSGRRWALMGGGTGRRVQDLRTGGGIDSHSVATRLLGLPSSVLGTRLAETGYTQSGVSGRMVWLPSSSDAITVSYLRGSQTGAEPLRPTQRRRRQSHCRLRPSNARLRPRALRAHRHEAVRLGIGHRLVQRPDWTTARRRASTTRRRACFRRSPGSTTAPTCSASRARPR